MWNYSKEEILRVEFIWGNRDTRVCLSDSGKFLNNIFAKTIEFIDLDKNSLEFLKIFPNIFLNYGLLHTGFLIFYSEEHFE